MDDCEKGKRKSECGGAELLAFKAWLQAQQNSSASADARGIRGVMGVTGGVITVAVVAQRSHCALPRMRRRSPVKYALPGLPVPVQSPLMISRSCPYGYPAPIRARRVSLFRNSLFRL